VGFLVRTIRGARHRGEPCPSLLLRGGSGLGKSTLAKALSEEYGSKFHKITATKQTDAIALGLAARDLGACDFILIDEPRALGPATQELLYLILDESMAPAVEERGDGRRPRLTGQVEVPPITLVLATDQTGLLCRALKTRMKLDFTLEPYGVKEMILIARQRASQLNMLISPQAARLLAETSHGVPRLLGHRVENMVHYYAEDWPTSFSVSYVRRFLKAQGIDRLGLSPGHRKYMLLLHNLGAEKISLGTLAASLYLDERSVSRDIEPLLTRHRWMGVAPSGRYLTGSGKRIVEENKEKWEHGRY